MPSNTHVGLLHIKNWEKYQSRLGDVKSGKRGVKWITLHTEALEDYTFGHLTWAQRGLLLSLWMLAPRTSPSPLDGAVPDDPVELSWHLRQEVSAEDLSVLISDGFLIRGDTCHHSGDTVATTVTTVATNDATLAQNGAREREEKRREEKRETGEESDTARAREAALADAEKLVEEFDALQMPDGGPPPQLVVAWVIEYGSEMIRELLRTKNLRGKRCGYVTTILESWKANPKERPSAKTANGGSPGSPGVGSSDYVPSRDEERGFLEEIRSQVALPPPEAWPEPLRLKVRLHETLGTSSATAAHYVRLLRAGISPISKREALLLERIDEAARPTEVVQ